MDLVLIGTMLYHSLLSLLMEIKKRKKRKREESILVLLDFARSVCVGEKVEEADRAVNAWNSNFIETSQILRFKLLQSSLTLSLSFFMASKCVIFLFSFWVTLITFKWYFRMRRMKNFYTVLAEDYNYNFLFLKHES